MPKSQDGGVLTKQVDGHGGIQEVQARSIDRAPTATYAWYRNWTMKIGVTAGSPEGREGREGITAQEAQEEATAWIFCRGKPFGALATEDFRLFG